ncbi:MAG TPA: hypothetical protein VL337_06880, partial [Acidimicrobiales bacterium]|nr:hypothetical protein [Acidimicrobiales bacterium]
MAASSETPETPPAAAAHAPAVPQQGAFLSRENGTRILHWMRAEFDGIRSQLQAVASGLAHQQALYADMAGNRGGELNSALAELEGSATQLRTEASRMRRDAGGLQEDGAELRRESARIRELEREMTERLPQVVADAVQPELRAALREVEAITAGLREEAAQLRGIRDGLTEQLPRLVDAAVRQALAGFVPPAPAPASPPPVGLAGSAPQANGFLDGAPAEPPVIGTAGMGAGAPAAPLASPLADEPAEPLPPPTAFGPPPAADPAAADGGVGEDPLACTLPGIVVGPSLALSVSEALRRAALRRRRRRRPAKPTPGLHRRDPFASQVTRRIDRYGRARTDLAALKPGTAGNGNGSAPTPPSRVALGFRDGEEIVVDLADHPVLALTGPAAADAARFLATAFLAGTGLLGGEAIVVGDLLPPGQSFPGLRQPADLAAAIEQLRSGGRPDATLLAVRDASVDGLAALAAAVAESPTRPPVVILVGDGPAGATVVRLGAGERVTEVSAEDLAGRLVGARLYTLAREAASELLGVLAGARTDEEVVAPPSGEAEAFEVTMPASPAVSVQLLGTYRIDV